MSQYAEFGLQTNKTTRDPGHKTPTFYDPWLQETVTGRNFYLCFSNWVISRRTIEAFRQQQPVDAIPGDQCQKCMARPGQMHYEIAGLVFEGGIELGICSDCLAAAASYLDKEPSPLPGTQFSLMGETKTAYKPKPTPKAIPIKPAPKPAKPDQLNLF